MDRILTIGVYGWSPERWITALRNAGCDLVVDIRARRGVRGREHAFANSTRLQALLHDADLPYVHLPSLAPSRATRDTQVAADALARRTKRDRSSLSEAFADAYRLQVVDQVDWAAILRTLNGTAPALLCVERLPTACHRSIVASELGRLEHVRVEDLVP